MSGLDLQRVDDLIEARKRFFHFEQKLPEQVPNWERQGHTINEACVVLLSATMQAFVEEVFLDCSYKVFGRTLQDKELDSYKKTWKLWGNPNQNNIKRLFQRLGCRDVFDSFSDAPGLSKVEFLTALDELNSARNCIAHGKPIKHNGLDLMINLPQLTKWRNQLDQGSREFRFCAMRKSGL